LATACGDRLVELDLNPVVVREKGAGAVAVDSLVVLQSGSPQGASKQGASPQGASPQGASKNSGSARSAGR